MPYTYNYENYVNVEKHKKEAHNPTTKSTQEEE